MIILTGASGGIGQAILPLLAVLDSVIAIYRSRKPKMEGLRSVTGYQADLTSESQIADFVSSIADRATRITLIHAAAVSRDGLAAKLRSDTWDEVVNVNLRANFLLTRAILMPMIEQKWGRLIHMSSVAGVRGVAGTLAYSSTKTGLLGMSRVLAHEYARFGITSNVLVLGYFNTGLISALRSGARDEILRSIPAGELGEPSNIANAIDFLIKSDYVNGSDIRIDGGM